jgi:hypothetical protein
LAFAFSGIVEWTRGFGDCVCCVGEACCIVFFFLWHWEVLFLLLHDQGI